MGQEDRTAYTSWNLLLEKTLIKTVDKISINRYTYVSEMVSVTAFVEAFLHLIKSLKKLNLGTDAQ